MENICTNCGESRSSKFCWKCGVETISLASLECPKCKHKLSVYDKFCEDCGIPVQEQIKGYVRDRKKILKQFKGKEVRGKLVDTEGNSF